MGMIVADFSGHVLEANDAFLAMVGHSREELQTGKLRWDQLTPPEFRAGDEQAMATLLEHEDCPPFEKEFFHKWGHRVPVLIGVTMLSHAKQECICFVLDITRQKQTERDLKLAKELADQASRAKSQFLANMSHEVRTPMNAVIGLTELVLNTPLETQQREYLQLVLQSGEGLLSVINDVLDFSKVESGHVQLDLQPANLRECLGDALKSLAVRAHGKQLELLLDIGLDVPGWFSTDSGRLRQIINNLVSNAIKFTYSGEVVVSVRRGTSKLNSSDETIPIMFCVADTGIGIAAEKQRLIFEPFEQADASTTRQFGGTGLGLSIVQRLVELMGGQITIESEVGKGSKFLFTLQLEPCEPPPQIETPRSGGLEGARVLVVDHHPTSRQILHDTLESWHMEPLIFEDAAQAGRMLMDASNGHAACDVVVTDLRPGDGNAWSLLEQLRANPTTAELPVILLLSHDSSELAPQCQRLGVKQRLFKPFKQSELFDALAAAMHLDVTSPPVPAIPIPAEEPKQAIAVRSLRILLAEDSLVNQRLAIGVLERLGHEATVANNGHEVLDLLQRESFDLALMDIQMPELDGLQTSLRIREQEAKTGGHLPIVAVTAHALKGDRERCLEVGMDGYVSKPIRQKQLIDEIERVLGTAIVPPTAALPPAPTAAEECIVDWRVALEFCNGDASLLREIAEAFLEEWPKRTTEIRRALDESNFDLLHRSAHTIKGSLRYFGADAPFATALELENLGSKHSLAGAEEKWTRLQHQVEQVIPLLVAYVQGKLRLPS